MTSTAYARRGLQHGARSVHSVDERLPGLGILACLMLAPLLVPVPASILALAGELEAGVWTTIIASSVAMIVSGWASLTYRGSGRVALIVDAALYAVVAVLSIVFLALLTVPQQGKLYRLNLNGFVGVGETIPSYFLLLWVISLAAFPVSAHLTRAPITTRRANFSARTAIALGSFGAVGLALMLTVSRAAAFAARGESGGNGLVSMLYWAAAAFIAYVVVGWEKSHSRSFLVAAVIATALIALTGNRSPLALVAVAVILRIVLDRRKVLLAIVGLCAPLGLAVFSYQSIWRSLVAQGLPAGPSVIFAQMASDPTREILRIGLDSIEGHTLARVVLERGFEARWTDPLTSVLNFVPRQFWPDKPILLGTQIGETYLGLGAGGLFMSGPGYLSLVAGSTLLGSIAFICFILAIKRGLCSERLPPLIATALVFLAIRFTVAGDAFDIFLTVQIAFLYWIAYCIGRLLPWHK